MDRVEFMVLRGEVVAVKDGVYLGLRVLGWDYGCHLEFRGADAMQGNLSVDPTS